MAERAPIAATSEMADARSGRPSLAWMLAMVLGVAMLWLSWGSIRKVYWVDLDVYLAGGHALLTGSDLYSVSVRDLPFTYPPFAAVLFVPLALLPVHLARVVMTVATIAALATVIEVLRRRLALRPVDVLPVGLVVLALEPLVRTVILGQINAILMALVVVDCFVVPARHRGWLVGIAAGIKLTPAVFIVWLLLRREWGAALRATTAGLLTVGVGLLVVPSSSVFYWTGGFGDLGRFGAASVLGTDNQSLSAVLARLGGLTSVPAPLAVGCGLLGVGLGAWVAARCLRRGDDVGALLSVALGGLLASPVSWSHHWLWVAPLLLWAMAGQRRAWAVILSAVFWLGPFWAAHRTVPDAAPYPPADRVVAAVYVICGFVALAVLARDSRRTSPDRAQPSGATSSV